MKRIPKFRAKYKGEIWEVLCIDFYKKEVKIQEITELPFDVKEITVPLKEVELLEYAGIKDKNKKEIREGHQIKYNDLIMTVVFSEGCFCAENDKGLFIIHNSEEKTEIINEV